MWPTPTPLPPLPTPEFLNNLDVQQFGQDMASGIVQGWNFFNSQTFSDLIFIILLLLIIVLGIMSIRSHLEKV